MNAIRTRELYSSSNGDRWLVCGDDTGRVFITHESNIPSGGNVARIEISDFLSRGHGPEQQALIALIGSTLESVD